MASSVHFARRGGPAARRLRRQWRRKGRDASHRDVRVLRLSPGGGPADPPAGAVPRDLPRLRGRAPGRGHQRRPPRGPAPPPPGTRPTPREAWAPRSPDPGAAATARRSRARPRRRGPAVAVSSPPDRRGARAHSSVGTSAALTSLRSQVRSLMRPRPSRESCRGVRAGEHRVRSRASQSRRPLLRSAGPSLCDVPRSPHRLPLRCRPGMVPAQNW